jgi:hypothetical protein
MTSEVTVHLPSELADALRDYALVTNASVDEVVRRAVVEYLKVHGPADLR